MKNLKRILGLILIAIFLVVSCPQVNAAPPTGSMYWSIPSSKDIGRTEEFSIQILDQNVWIDSPRMPPSGWIPYTYVKAKYYLVFRSQETRDKWATITDKVVKDASYMEVTYRWTIPSSANKLESAPRGTRTELKIIGSKEVLLYADYDSATKNPDYGTLEWNIYTWTIDFLKNNGQM